MNTAIYARYSSDKQSESSIEDQERNCLRYAERYGFNIVQRFHDKAISGTSKTRPGFDDMLASADRNDFDVLLVDDLSRLSRDDIQMKQIIRRFKFKRARIIGVSNGYDSNDKGEKIQSSMRGLMNELYLDDLRDKTHRGQYGKATQGYSAGGSVYGYRRLPIESLERLDVNGRPEIIAVEREINEDEAYWVRQIFEWFANGASPKQIAHKLNVLGIPSPRGSTWGGSTIYGDVTDGTGLLNNELYVGKYLWNRSAWVKDPDTGKRRRQKRVEADWMVKDMPELRIVPQDLWDKAKARQADIRIKTTVLREAMQNTNSKSRTGKYLFSGLLQCGCCAANYVVYSTQSYGCATNVNRGDAACPNRLRISHRMLDLHILGILQEKLLSEEAIDLFIGETTAALKAKQSDQQPEIVIYQRKLKTLDKQINNLVAAIAAGAGLGSIQTELRRLETDKTATEAAIGASANLADLIVPALPQAAERYQKLVADLAGTLQDDLPHAREILKTLLGKIRLLPSKCGKFLEAELRHSAEGLFKLATGDGLKVQMVAGARFELTTFRL